MKHNYLCGHTGSNNRGCDAIVRSTAGILRSVQDGEITLMTFAEQQDQQLGLDTVVNLRSYPCKSLFNRALGYIMRKVFKNGVWGCNFYHKELIKDACQEDVLLNIGGDTYCYSTPYLSYSLNEMASQRGIPTVFWGCSVDQRVLKNPQMQKDINRYAHIVVRESLSYELLRTCVSDSEKIHLACDPAFTLEPQETPLPTEFLPNNTVGINLSPLVFRNYKDEKDIMYQNAVTLIDFLLEQTDMAVCLIPHVYDIITGSQDLDVLNVLYRKYMTNSRVSFVQEDLNSAQLKYIISKCRFFIGARTHSMIAAYSSMVPALALSYSIKSLGIAQDIFGTYESYAIDWKDFTLPTQLRDAFIQTLQLNEEQILEHYRQVMPEYRSQIIRTAQKIFG